MERRFRDDLKWALCVLAGAAIAYLVFDGDDPVLLVGVLVGCAVAIAVVNGVRRVRRAAARK
jgi:hypothetical protein